MFCQFMKGLAKYIQCITCMTWWLSTFHIDAFSENFGHRRHQTTVFDLFSDTKFTWTFSDDIESSSVPADSFILKADLWRKPHFKNLFYCRSKKFLLLMKLILFDDLLEVTVLTTKTHCSALSSAPSSTGKKDFLKEARMKDKQYSGPSHRLVLRTGKRKFTKHCDALNVRRERRLPNI